MPTKEDAVCKKTLTSCRTHDDVIGFARHAGWQVVEGHCHTKIYPSPQDHTKMVPVPRHPGDLARGTLKSIVKILVTFGALVAVGLAIMAVL
jgi:predicted RNA binding protein YcfA (HicA-like mRNA interferase family)